MFKIFSMLLVLVYGLSSSTAAFAEGKKLPVEVFAKLPDMNQAKLSPSGKKIGYFVDYKGKVALVIENLDATEPMVIPSPDIGSITQFYWGNDDTIVFGSEGTLKRVVFASKTTETRMFSYNLKTEKLVWLGEPKVKLGRKNKGEQQTASQLERIIDLLSNDPDHILLQLDFELDGEASVYKVNLNDGRRQEIKKDLRGIQNWYADQNSEIRLGTGFDGSEYRIMFKGLDGKWTSLKKSDWYKKYDFEGFTENLNHIYVSGATEEGTNGLFKLDLETGEIIEKLFSHNKVDIDYITEHPVTGKTVGVAYTTDLQHVEYFDKTLAKIQRSIAKALKNPNLRLVNMAKDQELYLFLASDDRDAGTYYLYDRPNKKLEQYAFVRRHIDPALMASVISVDIPTRDEYKIPSFITVPNGVETPEKMPTIIMPHGGPFGVRDDAHWDYWSQFYANRGYLVVRPNFRGSGGYGNYHYAKGIKQWGGLMQDDVTDATKWVIDQGYADPERICIVGWSYGGYAALMGPIMEPGLYKCSISINGVANLPRLKLNDKNASIGGRSWIKRMGHADKKDQEVSPYHRVDELNVPVMLIASKDDSRVPYQHSGQIHSALKKNGIESEYLLFDHGGHSLLYSSENRQKMLAATEKFLKKHIGD